MPTNEEAGLGPADTSSRPEFLEYYAMASLSAATIDRYLHILKTIEHVRGRFDPDSSLVVADIGCGAGAQCEIWARRGHKVVGLDINEPLIELARRRAEDQRLSIAYSVGSATSLPWESSSIDICIMPELLEHVADWKSCLGEACRVLGPNGTLFLTTTNVWCPRQEEFNLPAYSWYPSIAKHYFERLARTTHPKLANYATYPAVNWFSFGQLSRYLDGQGFECFDRFRAADIDGSLMRREALRALRWSRPLRALAQLVSPYTQLVATRRAK